MWKTKQKRRRPVVHGTNKSRKRHFKCLGKTISEKSTEQKTTPNKASQGELK